MRFITRSNQPLAPAATIIAPQAMKAPMPCAMSTPAPAVTSSAAPGVDHAVSTGWR